MFPTTQLPLRVKIAPGASPGSDPITWPSWIDISADVRVEQGITLSDGRPNESSVVDPGEATFTVDNRSGRYVVGNPNSNLYPLLRRNCPCRVGVEIFRDTFTRTSSSGWGTPDLPNFPGVSYAGTGTLTDYTVSGSDARVAVVSNQARVCIATGANAYNVEGRVTMAVGVMPTGDAFIHGVVARYLDTSNYYLIELRFETTGTFTMVAARNRLGSFNNLNTNVTIPGTFTAGARIILAWQVNGANIVAKAWPEAGVEPANWQMSVNDTQLVKGGGNGFLAWRPAGSTNAGAQQFIYDDFRLESIEWSGNLTELPVRWDQSGRDSTAPMRANGILRRLGQGSAPLKSPLYRQLSAQSPTGYWPLEDDAGATAPTTPLPATSGVRPALARGLTFGVSPVATTTLAGTSSVVQFTDPAAQALFYANSGPVGTGGAVTFFIKFATPFPGSMQQFASIFIENGPVRKWVLASDNSTNQLTGFDSANNVVVGPIVSAWAVTMSDWISMEFGCNVVGANTNYTLLWRSLGQASAFIVTGSFAGTIPPRITSAQFFANGGQFTNMSLAHVWIGVNTVPWNTYTFYAVSVGYAGELASDRIVRLCGEEGVPAYAEPGPSEPMGVQTTSGLLALLRECEQTDFGVLYEDGFGLGYRPRSQRYGKAVDITLDVSQGHLAAAPEPIIDDQAIRNSVVVSRPNGGQGITASDPVHIAAEGRYEDAATVNAQFDQALQYNAQWRVYLGTRPDMRLARVSLDMARNVGSLLASWRGRPRWGARAVMTNVPSQLFNQAPDMIVEGASQTLGPYQWDVDANTSPAVPWDVAVADSTALGRADTAGSQLTTAVNTTAVTFIVATTAGPVWRTGAYPSTPIVIEGEIVLLTNIASTTSPQTFTVTRSANGVVKAHAIGATLSLAYPARAAL